MLVLFLFLNPFQFSDFTSDSNDHEVDTSEIRSFGASNTEGIGNAHLKCTARKEHIIDSTREGKEDAETEYRSLWTVGYRIVNHTDIIDLVDFAVTHNFNAVSPIINGEWAGVYYNSEFYPKHVDVKPDFNPLMTLCIEAHKKGIEIHPWISVMPNYFACRDHPEWRQVSSSGAPVNWINPAIPEAREFVVDILMEIASYPIDGMKLDHIRYRSGSYSYDSYSNQAFAESGYSSRRDWQADELTKMVRMFRERVNDYKPYLWIGADVASGYSWGYSSWYQDARRWTEENLVDYLTPMTYTTSRSSFRSCADNHVDHCNGKNIYVGTYVYTPENSAHGSVNTEEQGIDLLKDQITIARQEGAKGVCLFKYWYFKNYPNYGWAIRDSVFSEKLLSPLKVMDVPVMKNCWNFDRPTLKDGWEIFPRRNDYPMDGRWDIHDLTAGTYLRSPLVQLDPSVNTSIEARLKNSGAQPVTILFEWTNKAGITYPGNDQEKVRFIVPPDNEFHKIGIRLEEHPGWIRIANNTEECLNITGLKLILEDSPDPSTVLSIDYFKFLEVPRTQKEWLFLGPFSNLDYPHALENQYIELDTGNLYDSGSGDFWDESPSPGDVENGLEWYQYTSPCDYIDLAEEDLNLKYNSIYAFSNILTREKGEYELRIGADDGIEVWLNGELILLEERKTNCAWADEFVVPVTFKQGINRILLKVVQSEDEYGFYARLTLPGNQSLDPYQEDAVQFYPCLPEIPTPLPEDLLEGWSNQTCPVFRIELIDIYNNDPLFNIGRYWWNVDEGSAECYKVSSVDIDRGFLEIQVPRVENGSHIFGICAQDNLGRNSSLGTHTFHHDSYRIRCSSPVPDRKLISVTILATGPQSIKWDWDMIGNSPSGLNWTRILIGNAPYKENILNYTLEGNITTFTFQGITEKYTEIYLTIIPYGNTGIKGYYSVAEIPVLIDRIRPYKVNSLVAEVRLSEDNRELMGYFIKWNSTEDAGGGVVDIYILQYTSQNMQGWEVLTVTAGDKCQYDFNNIKRSERFRFRVFAVDSGGNEGIKSDEFMVENLAPSAKIWLDKCSIEECYEGQPVKFSSKESFDPDGVITGYFWTFGDGTFSYTRDCFHTYRCPGVFNITLSVYDDFGKYDRTWSRIIITEKKGFLINNSFETKDEDEKIIDKKDINSSSAVTSGGDGQGNEDNLIFGFAPGDFYLYTLIITILLITCLLAISLFFIKNKSRASYQRVADDPIGWTNNMSLVLNEIYELETLLLSSVNGSEKRNEGGEK